MESDDLLCSRNARPQKAVVGRAQWKINQPPSPRDNERAWRDQLEWISARSTAAAEIIPTTPRETGRVVVHPGIDERQIAQVRMSQRFSYGKG